MAKVEGPEEFFEALRAAQRDQKAAATQPAPGPAPEPEDRAEPEPAPQPVAPAEPAPVAPEVAPEAPDPNRTYPMSVFAKDDPTVTIRRSTLIFAIIGAIVLLFIAFAVGRRTAPRPKATRSRTTEREGYREVRQPSVPDGFRGKVRICVKTFDHTQEAGLANARAYRKFFNTAPETAFIRTRGKKAFILQYERQLQVCIGPFEGIETPAVDELGPKIKDLKFGGVRQFSNPYAAKIPPYSTVIN